MTTTLNALLECSGKLLNSDVIKDYCPNGLQVEGKQSVSHIVTGVTASMALIEAALEQRADAILVHHGYFWKGEDARVIGMKKRRLACLLAADVSLIGYHLPLDIHPILGNNVQLAERLGIVIDGGLEVGNPNSVGLYGHLQTPMKASKFAKKIADVLQREPLHVAAGDDIIKTIGWCTGAAQGYINKAIDLNLDAYLTGEASEPTTHAARENGLHFFAAGHHATERYGIKALGDYLADTLGVTHQFIDIDNPV